VSSLLGRDLRSREARSAEADDEDVLVFELDHEVHPSGWEVT
jgi:hypothetical protein